ncbi:OLC1v1028624C1 [Oldenlandia corymbosa var. corymbosa]|uniref:OLC1v1028624C1 n=1 Tax=Oldenlandia corymbosa var. corymbosa TaxID=529605 RepID=A0AAV1CCW1_OLDCO|nr:OLC1v1028624C1 [Oldenlandia corymbosa var. corymbosa]
MENYAHSFHYSSSSNPPFSDFPIMTTTSGNIVNDIIDHHHHHHHHSNNVLMVSPTSDVMSNSFGAGGGGNNSTTQEQITTDHHHQEEVKSGKKKGETNNTKKMKKPRYAFQTRSQVDILDDGYRWRKYGQKAVKNNKFPRSYYRCTHQGCNVKKQVQRLSKDEGVVVTTYEGMHSHPIEKSTDNFEHILSQMQIYTAM